MHSGCAKTNRVEVFGPLRPGPKSPGRLPCAVVRAVDAFLALKACLCTTCPCSCLVLLRLLVVHVPSASNLAASTFELYVLLPYKSLSRLCSLLDHIYLNERTVICQSRATFAYTTL